MAEMHDADVVTDVRVRQEYAVECVLAIRCDLLQCVKLLAHIRRRIEQVF